MGHYLGEMEEDGVPLSMKMSSLGGGISSGDGDFMKQVARRHESKLLLRERGVVEPSRELADKLTKALDVRRWEFQRVREAAQLEIDRITNKALDEVLGERPGSKDPDTGDIINVGGEVVAPPPAEPAPTPQVQVPLAVCCVNWIEVEPGWGNRPDGHTLHVSYDVASAYCDATRARPTSVGQCYSVPGEVFLVEVDTETAVKVRREGTIWGHHTQQRARP